MSGDMPAAGPRSMDGAPRNLGNGRHSPTSPLKLFGQAKKKINDVFIEIGTYTTDCDHFLCKLDLEEGIVTDDKVQEVNQYINKVKGIQEILARDRMKVAFFGRTSNGKSSVINAMLKAKILPSGYGHTTNCFLQIEGCDGSDGFILVGDSEEKRSIQSISELASAISDMKLEHDALIRICWPKEKCNLLRDDVVLVDSPGIDVTPDLDSWIDSFCLDADVFVLVANAESTLTTTEKNFFHKVSSRLSKPNIFVLNNRWDASALEPEMMEEVRKQHEERNMTFLVDELKVASPQEARDRVYFVSAREALVARSNQERGTPTPSGSLLDGHQGRLFEFCNFERKFEECISQSAVQTKFAQHTANGKEITAQLRSTLENVSSNAAERKGVAEQDQRETKDQLDYTEQQMALLTAEIRDGIRQMTEEVERKVSSALVDEIRRLAVLVDEFERPFHPDPMLLNVYKKELHVHVEDLLKRNLESRCNSFVMKALGAVETEMQERLLALLPGDTKQNTQNVLPNREFDVAYRLDCRNLCADFREDVEFRFSLGISAMMKRFLGTKGARSVMMSHAGFQDPTASIQRPLVLTPQTPCNEGQGQTDGIDNEMLLAMVGTFTSLYSRSTIGAMAITGLAAKAAGWRVIAICGAIYGLVYIYERLTWTKKAQERAFKRQYVDYASSKLKLIVDLTSANCSHQVQQELQSTFSRLSHQVEQAKGDLKEEVERLNGEVKRLEETTSRATFLRNKANYLDSELNTFIHNFLKPDSRL